MTENPYSALSGADLLWCRDITKAGLELIILERIRRARLLRQFAPFSTPAPYSHEQEPGWDQFQGMESCDCCPHYQEVFDWVDQEFLMECLLLGYECPTRCRFTEYRHFLFRRFEPFTEGE